MLALIPILAAYLLNSYQLSIQEIWLPMVLNVVLAAIISTIFYHTWRHNRLRAYIGATFATLLLTINYDARLVAIEPILQAVVPLPKSTSPIYSLILIAIICYAAYWLGRLTNNITLKRKWDTKTIIKAITIAISVTFVLQLIPTVKNLAIAWPQFFYQPPKLKAASSTAKTAAKPDIYYIVMDRYASPDILKEQFNYDNADFMKFLADKQFYINADSHQNYPYTAQSVASTMNADYNHNMIQKFGNSSVQTTIPYNQTIRNAPIAQYLKSIGYKYSLIGNWYETSNISPLADETYQVEGLLTVLNQTYIIDNFAKNQLRESAFWRFLQTGLSFGKYKALDYQNAGDDQMTLGQLKALKAIANGPAGEKFVFAHFLVPHDPYFFNADGSLNTNNSSDNYGAPIKQKYLNQVKFINGQMQQIISSIMTKTGGKAVIVLQSDEGPYPFDLNDENFNHDAIQGELASGNMLKWSKTDLAIKYGNLAAYYVPGASQTNLVAGGTTVNAFRLVLNTLFSTNMTYLTECYYAYPNGRGRPLYYQSIDQQLTGKTNPTCSNNGTGPKR